MSFVAPPRRVAGLILCSLAAGVLFLAGCRMAQSPPPPSSPSINTGAEASPNVEAVRTTETEQAGMFQRLVPCESAEESPQAPRRLTANIEGEVTDATGAVMPGAEVTVTSDASGWFRRDYSDEVGKYNFPILRPGSYTIEARVEGFKVATRSGVQVDREPSVRIDFELEIGEVYTESDFPPLHVAGGNRNPAVIEALLDADADPTARNAACETPRDLAQENEQLRGTDVSRRLNDKVARRPPLPNEEP